MTAKVYLIGAGPGDPDLITIKGLECIKRADTIIYDYLASEALLAHARPETKLIYVGKKGFSKHITQDQINSIIIEEATGEAAACPFDERMIVRLKGGDPFVFGRGGEEAQALRKHGIEVEVVPGVTSGIAAPASAGIPVTHRGVSTSVAFITGNEDPTKAESDIDWEGIAHGAQTLCFYMGIKNLPFICEKLITAGRSPRTPVALIRWGTTPKQEELFGNLEDIAQKAEEAGFQAPAIIVVGDVVGLRDTIGTRTPLPLEGFTVAVTRSRTQSSNMVARLKGLGADVLECPTIQIEPLASYAEADRAIEGLAHGAFDWLILTSTNGVDFFFDRLHALGMDSRALAVVKLAAIGSATANQIARHGIATDLVPSQYRGEAVVREMLEAGAESGERVLLARAKEARNAIPDLLTQAGLTVETVPLYETVPSTAPQTLQSLDRILAGEVDAVTFTSSSTVRNFCRLLENRADCLQLPDSKIAGILSGMNLYSIGPVTSETLRENGLQPQAEARVYTIDGLIDAILQDRMNR